MVSLLLLLAWIALVLVVTGAPIATDDLWWHLALGRSYASEGPWLPRDPLLATPLGAPEPASWLFDVAADGVLSLAGFQGLRVVHTALVLAIIALVAHLAWRASRANPPAAALATGAFLAVSWYRLVQLRPELVTILVTLGTYALLLARPEPPSRGRVAAACVLMVLGANAHAGFLLAPILIAAGVAGLLLRAGLEHRAGAIAARDATVARARRVGFALALGLVLALLNPRGIAQHLAPLSPLVDARLPMVRDEWTAFDPFALPAAATRMSLLAWLIADALLVGVAAAGGTLLLRFARDRSARPVVRDEPVLLALAVTAAAAMAVAIRLHWLAVFAVLLPLTLGPGGGDARSAPRRPLLRWGCTLALAALLVAAPIWGGLKPTRLGVPTQLSAFLTTPYAADRYHAEAVWFLQDATLSGLVFSNYYLGGFLGYWLAPRIQTFVNGTLNFPPRRLLDDYEAVMRARSTATGEGYLDVLRSRDVDLFVGVGLPQVRDPHLPARYTTPLLEGAPDWVCVFRNLTSAVYVRRVEGREDLARASAYYLREGIPFDPDRGFDAEAVIRERPDWAAGHGLAPGDFPEILAASSVRDPRVRLPALERLGALYAALGLYPQGVSVELRILADFPRAVAARQRLLFDLLHLGRSDDVLRNGRAHDPSSPRDALTEGYVRIAERAAQGEPIPPLLPLFTSREASRVLTGVPPAALRPPRP